MNTLKNKYKFKSDIVTLKMLCIVLAVVFSFASAIGTDVNHYLVAGTFLFTVISLFLVINGDLEKMKIIDDYDKIVDDNDMLNKKITLKFNESIIVKAKKPIMIQHQHTINRSLILQNMSGFTEEKLINDVENEMNTNIFNEIKPFIETITYKDRYGNDVINKRIYVYNNNNN